MYKFLHEWEARERERERTPHSITLQTHFILRDVSHLNFYEEVTPLRRNTSFL
jgi:hypothetical protein